MKKIFVSDFSLTEIYKGIKNFTLKLSQPLKPLTLKLSQQDSNPHPQACI